MIELLSKASFGLSQVLQEADFFGLAFSSSRKKNLNVKRSHLVAKAGEATVFVT